MNGFRSRRRLSDDSGSIAVEVIIVVPVLISAFLLMFVLFDAFRTRSVSNKLSYTLADVITRETDPIDAAYINGMARMQSYWLGLDGSSRASIRISSLAYDDARGAYEIEWSQASGPLLGSMTSTDLSNSSGRLPSSITDRTLVVVELKYIYEPPFSTPFSSYEVHDFVFMKPRFVPTIMFGT